METNQYTKHLHKESENELFYPIDQTSVNRLALREILKSDAKIQWIEAYVSLCNDPEQLLLFAQHYKTSSRALTEIVSHWRNAVCWEAVIRHKNVTAFHLELIMEYPDEIHWFETECAIATCPHITRQIIDELLRRNALIQEHFYHRSHPRLLFQKQMIATLLLSNPSVPFQYREQCKIIQDDGVIMVEKIA